MKCSLETFHEMFSNFLEEIFSLSNSILFLCFFALITEEGLFYLSLLFYGTLHSNGYILPFLLCFSLLFFSQLFVRPPKRPYKLECLSIRNNGYELLDIYLMSHCLRIIRRLDSVGLGWGLRIFIFPSMPFE